MTSNIENIDVVEGDNCSPIIYFYLTVVRHGETNENVNKIIQGNLDTILSEKGISQANNLGKTLSSLHVDYIYSSDLQRAYKTAESIKNALSHPVPHRVDSLMQERTFGNFNGKLRSELNQFIRSIPDNPSSCIKWHNVNAECSHQVYLRVLNSISNLCKTMESEPNRPAPNFDKLKGRTTLLLPISSSPIQIMFNQPSSVKNNSQLSNLFSHHKNLQYKGHVVIVSHGVWLRQLSLLLGSGSILNAGFPPPECLLSGYGNCELSQFGVAFQPSQLAKFQALLCPTCSPKVTIKPATSACRFDLGLPALPVCAVCYHFQMETSEAFSITSVVSRDHAKRESTTSLNSLDRATELDAATIIDEYHEEDIA